MPISKLRPTFTFGQDRIEQLKAIAPEAFADSINYRHITDDTLNGWHEEPN